jgi:small subunit ribosomal protein S13
MVYLLGINLPDKKLVHIALTSIYGIGLHTAQRLCHKLEIHPACRLENLGDEKIVMLSQELNQMNIDSAIKKQVKQSILKLVTLGTYRGLRHQAGLPVRGQKTRTNAATAKKLNKLRFK